MITIEFGYFKHSEIVGEKTVTEVVIEETEEYDPKILEHMSELQNIIDGMKDFEVEENIFYSSDMMSKEFFDYIYLYIENNFDDLESGHFDKLTNMDNEYFSSIEVHILIQIIDICAILGEKIMKNKLITYIASSLSGKTSEEMIEYLQLSYMDEDDGISGFYVTRHADEELIILEEENKLMTYM